MDNMDIMYIVGELIETLTFVIREVKANHLELEAQNKHIENLVYELEMIKSELSRMKKVRK
jgi:hypothetical protein